MSEKSGGHSLHAFTKEGDFIPMLYVIGQIKAKGDFVGVHLEETPLFEKRPGSLGLKFVPDEYDPNGHSKVQVTPFHKVLHTDDEFNKVVILSEHGNIELEIVHMPRQAFGGEVPR